MTSPAPVLDDTHVILLDFDGPTADLFSEYPPEVLADDFRHYLHNIDRAVPKRAVAPGPFELYEWALAQHPEMTEEIESWLSGAETRAATRAEPTPGCGEMLLAAYEAGRPVVIVSNNSEAAIRVYLDRHSLASYVSGITGRPYAAPERMKPHPWSIQHAAHGQQVPVSVCVLIGDSVADIEAANAAGSASIGYANKPGKAERLGDAGATALVNDMYVLADAIRTSRTSVVGTDRG